MSYDKDPPPLADSSSEAPERLRSLLRSAKSDVPTAADLARLEAKLGPLLSGSGVPAAASGSSALGKASLAVLGGLVVAGGLYLTTRPSPRAPERAPAPSAAVREPATSASEATPPAAPAPDTASSPGVEAAKPAETAPATARSETGAARPSPVPEDQLLERARRALGSDPSRALSLTREHAKSYPNGVLAQEREVIAIEALKRLGRGSEADARRGTFEQRYPQSAHRRNLEGPAKADGGK
jgi:outer membrane biosynthesis protein TonB